VVVITGERLRLAGQRGVWGDRRGATVVRSKVAVLSQRQPVGGQLRVRRSSESLPVTATVGLSPSTATASTTSVRPTSPMTDLVVPRSVRQQRPAPDHPTVRSTTSGGGRVRCCAPMVALLMAARSRPAGAVARSDCIDKHRGGRRAGRTGSPCTWRARPLAGQRPGRPDS
jgi:hypothetical protein